MVNVSGRYPQLSLQGNPEAKYSGINWFDSDGRQVAALVADLPDNDLSLYAASPDGWRKALDLHYGDEELGLTFKNTRSLFISGGDADTDTILGIQAGSQRGDSILRFVNENNHSVWGLLRDASTGEDFRLYNYQIGRTALTVLADTNAISFHGNPSVGLREVHDPTPSDLAHREWAWDATDDRWLYKNDEGTVHYFEPDGTL